MGCTLRRTYHSWQRRAPRRLSRIACTECRSQPASVTYCCGDFSVVGELWVVGHMQSMTAVGAARVRRSVVDGNGGGYHCLDGSELRSPGAWRQLLAEERCARGD